MTESKQLQLTASCSRLLAQCMAVHLFMVMATCVQRIRATLREVLEKLGSPPFLVVVGHM